jgi:hypothetical protein
VKLILDIHHDPNGRLTGTATTVGGSELCRFSGVMELLAGIEQLVAHAPGGTAEPESDGTGP